MLSNIISAHLNQNLASLAPDGVEAHLHPHGGYTLTLWANSEQAKDALVKNLEEIMALADNLLPVTQISIKGHWEFSFQFAPIRRLHPTLRDGVLDKLAAQERATRPPEAGPRRG